MVFMGLSRAMAEVDTSIYPKADNGNIINTLATIQGIRNAQEQNRLLQLEQQRQGVALNSDQIDYAHKQFDGLSQLIGSLAQDPRIGGPQGPSVVQQYGQNAVRQGFITPQQYQSAMQTMPQDPAQLPQWLQTLNTQHLDAQQRFTAQYGTPSTISNGSQILPVTVSPITGIRPIAAPINETLGPGERSTLVNTTGPNGQPVITPKANILTQAGMNPLTAMPQSAPSGPANQLIPSQQPQAANSAPAGNGQGGVIAGPAAGEVEAQTAQATASSNKFSADQQREANFAQDMLPLNKAYQGMKALGTTGTGPGTETMNDVKSFLVSQGIIGPNEDVKNFDEVRKYATQLARQNGDTGSDSRLAASFAGNPSVNISNAAAQDVLKSAISLRKLQNAQVQAFSQSGQSPSQYQKFSVQFAKSQDPVAYGFDLMDPAARVKYYQGLDDAGKTKFMNSLQTAQSLGLISPPSNESGTANGG